MVRLYSRRSWYPPSRSADCTSTGGARRAVCVTHCRTVCMTHCHTDRMTHCLTDSASPGTFALRAGRSMEPPSIHRPSCASGRLLRGSVSGRTTALTRFSPLYSSLRMTVRRFLAGIASTSAARRDTYAERTELCGTKLSRIGHAWYPASTPSTSSPNSSPGTLAGRSPPPSQQIHSPNGGPADAFHSPS
jgi:hypothetical protein